MERKRGLGKNFHNKEIHDSNASQIIITAIKQAEMSGTRGTNWEKINAKKISVGKPR